VSPLSSLCFDLPDFIPSQDNREGFGGKITIPREGILPGDWLLYSEKPRK
jgi:hypothetical protein